MNIASIKNTLSELFISHFGFVPSKIIQLPGSGSERIYFRISSEKQTVIGAYNANVKENEAFFSFTQTFKELKINVPEIFIISQDQQHYLQSDLGDETLFHSIKKNKNTKEGKSVLCHIKKSLHHLISIQIEGGKHIDFSKCYPRPAFDAQSILWDLNYFKYEFLKLAKVPFDEQALEDDFKTITNYLSETPSDYFMYRDFQSRNIMIKADEPWFIDYQGGRKGPLQYDLASMLYSPKTALNSIQKEALLDFYIKELNEKIEIDPLDFTNRYYGFVLIRILQALGAYGYRGIFEKKSNFISSIPLAIVNLYDLFTDKKFRIALPELEKIVDHLSQSEWSKTIEIPNNKLTLRIVSFSYKNGIPTDPSENGGGFVFDCRGLQNPGRYEEYKSLSGLDDNVIDYLEKYDEVKQFHENVKNLVAISIEEYLKRGFNHLCINFGCTGGQHRSVYNAEKIAQWAANNFPVKVVLIHQEMEKWKRNE